MPRCVTLNLSTNTIVPRLIRKFFFFSPFLFQKLHHQITVEHSHIRESFVKKIDYIFEDIQFPAKGTSAETTRLRQDFVQPLRRNNKFIYAKSPSGKLVKPFTSSYIQRSLYLYLFCCKKPRFAEALAKDEHINRGGVHLCKYLFCWLLLKYPRTYI